MLGKDTVKLPKVVTVVNQKGGVGKTTTAINLASSLVSLGKKVVLVDFDPQGNASTGLGVSLEDRSLTSYDVLVEKRPLKDALRACRQHGLWVVPANADLSSADLTLAGGKERVTAFSSSLEEFLSDATQIDYIFVDCPPSLNLLTINALVASDTALVPLQPEFFALEGLSQLLLTIRDIRKVANESLRLEGVVLTMYDRRNNLTGQVEEDARKNLGQLVFETVIPRNVKLSEAPSYGESILSYSPSSSGNKAYMRLAEEFLNRQGA